MKTRFYLLAVALLSMAGCDKVDEGKPAIKVEDPHSLNQTVYADQTDGATAVSFTTTGAWSSSIVPVAVQSAVVTSRGDGAHLWISIFPESGNSAGSHSVEILTDQNTSGADRSAIITITSGGKSIKVTVTQKSTKEDGSPYSNEETEYAISIDKPSLELFRNSTATLKATITPDDEGVGSITWESSDNGVATVDAGGKVSAVAVGEAVITARMGEYFAECAIAVNPDIYLCGNEHVNTADAAQKPMIWKNGSVLYSLSHPGIPEVDWIVVSAMCIHKGDVYAVGYYAHNTADTREKGGLVWKNGQVIYKIFDRKDMGFVPDNIEFFGMCMDGDDILICGTRKYEGRIWKNDNTLHPLGSADVPFAICKYGERVVSAGQIIAGGGGSQAAVWNNELPMYTLTPAAWYLEAGAMSVCVSGNDVYTAGYEGNAAKVWKNGGVLYELANPGSVKSIILSGNDIYAAGKDGVSGTVWKNGQVHFTIKKDETSYDKLYVDVMAISGNDVFTAGSENNRSHGTYGKVWKNGRLLYTLCSGETMNTSVGFGSMVLSK